MRISRRGIWREPAWRPAGRVLRATLPQKLVAWLFDSGSLTQRLQRASGGDFRVAVLSQRLQRPLLNERLALGMRADEYGIVREVHLICRGEPWVYARSVIPMATLQGAGRQLAWLGERPLGAFLFAIPGVVREPMEIARVTPEQPVYHTATGGLELKREAVWGRRSLFRFSRRTLLVSEFFLPSIPFLE